MVRADGRKAEELLAEYEKHAPKDHQPLTFADVERIWAECVRPKLPEFKTMQNVGAADAPGAESRWSLNCHVPEGMG